MGNIEVLFKFNLKLEINIVMTFFIILNLFFFIFLYLFFKLSKIIILNYFNSLNDPNLYIFILFFNYS